MLRIGKRLKRLYNDYRWEKEIRKANKDVKKKAPIDQLVVFDTAIASENLGDHIIQYYSKKVIDEIFPDKKRLIVPTHKLPSPEEINVIAASANKIVCGTNLITPHYEEYSNWKMPGDLYGYQNIITLGVGWGYYCQDISKYSRVVYSTILSKNALHSVRDGYTLNKFNEMGISNVINTGCPTLWGLTKDHCKLIPTHRSSRVVTTITDYDRDIEADKRMLKVLLDEYESVYIWIQGSGDYEYINSITDVNSLNIVPRDLNSFTALLESGDIDYVGTRLHAGIHAMNKKVRSIIIAIDNRALEMGKDFNLPIIKRDTSGEDLAGLINKEFSTDVCIDENAINRWKDQFK